MKVVFDHQIFAVQRYGGFTKYFVSLLRALRGLPGVRVDVIAPAHVNEYLSGDDSDCALTFRLRKPVRGLYYRPTLVSPAFRLLCAWNRPDIVHETHYLLNGGHVPNGVPVVATCHDMILERHSDNSTATNGAIARKKRALDRASGIVCISNNTRNELLEIYPYLEDRVATVHHGVSRVSPAQDFGGFLPAQYLLYVGMRSAYKNFAKAMQAFSALGPAYKSYSLVCFGGGGFTEGEKRGAVDCGLALGRLMHISGNDYQLAMAYERATALVYPSLDEGFGMPLTEAMIQGCAIICSNTSCFPEICLDAAQYFNPFSVESIKSAMVRVIDDADWREELVIRGRRRAEHFSWAACAEQTNALYRSVAIARR